MFQIIRYFSIRWWSLGTLLVAGTVVVAGTVLGEEKMAPVVTYEDDVAPIFRQKCFTCHNPDKKSGDLDLTNYTNLMQGGGSGAVVEPGDAGSSYLYSLITHESEPAMPPESPKLPDEMLETVRKWIDGGVLETKSSKAKVKKKKSVDLALASSSNERPEVVAVPGRLSLEPVTYTESTTAVTALATSPWAPLVAVAGQRQVMVYDAQSRDLRAVLPFPEGTVHVLKFSRNGSLLLAGGGTGGASGRVVVWSVRSGERVMEVGDELDAVLAADISSDQTLIALGGPQRVVRIYSTESGQLLHEIRKHTDWVTALEFSPDSVLLASGDRAGGLYVWEGWTGREYLTLKAHTDRVTAVSWRSDSNIVASASEDGSIRLWEMENGGQVKNWGGHGGGTTCIEFTRDGRLVSTGRDRLAKLWDQEGKQQRAFDAFTDLALAVSYCDETNQVIAGDWTGMVQMWNAEDGKSTGTLSSNPPTLAMRQEAAAVRLAEARTKLQPVEQVFLAAQASWNQLQAQLQEATKMASEAKNALDGKTSALAAAVAARDSAKAELEKSRQNVDTLKKAVEAVNIAAENAQAAAGNLPDDADLKQAIEKLTAVQQQRTTQREAAIVAMTSQQAALDQMNVAVQTSQNEVATATDAHAAAMKILQDLQAQGSAIEKQFQEAQAAYQPEADAAVAAEQEVAKWEAAVAFHSQLTALQQQRGEAQNSLTEKEEAYAAKLEEMEAAKKAAADAEAALNALQQQINTLRETE